MDPLVPLATPEDLQAVHGGSLLPEAKVTAAGEEVRALAGWHIAPEITETVVLDHNGGNRIILPSRRVVDITLVESLEGDTPVVLQGWRWSADGWLMMPVNSVRIPWGPRSIRVTMVHGFPSIPQGLIRTVMDRTQRRIVQEGIGARSATYSEAADRGVEAILDKYSLGPRP